MMTKGMEQAGKKREKTQDKDTNIQCPKCREVVGVVAAGYSIVLGKKNNAIRQTCLCKCGFAMKFSIEKV